MPYYKALTSLFLGLFMVLTASASYGGFYTAETPMGVSPDNVSFSYHAKEDKAGYGQHHGPYKILMKQGSLQGNLNRLAAQYNWGRLVWSPVKDFQWPKTETISADNLNDLFMVLLANYPLQAHFYKQYDLIVIKYRGTKH